MIGDMPCGVGLLLSISRSLLQARLVDAPKDIDMVGAVVEIEVKGFTIALVLLPKGVTVLWVGTVDPLGAVVEIEVKGFTIALVLLPKGVPVLWVGAVDPKGVDIDDVAKGVADKELYASEEGACRGGPPKGLLLADPKFVIEVGPNDKLALPADPYIDAVFWFDPNADGAGEEIGPNAAELLPVPKPPDANTVVAAEGFCTDPKGSAEIGLPKGAGEAELPKPVLIANPWAGPLLLPKTEVGLPKRGAARAGAGAANATAGAKETGAPKAGGDVEAPNPVLLDCV
jgi:hypothetical protein